MTLPRKTWISSSREPSNANNISFNTHVQSARIERAEVRSILALSPFRRLLAARLFSQLADGLLQAALGTFVLFSPERQTNATGVAVVFAVLLLPYSLVGPFAGLILDRWQRRDVLFWASILRAFFIGIIAWQVSAGRAGADLAIVVLIALGLNRMIQTTQAASLANTVTPELLVTANALAPTAGTVFSAVATVFGAILRSAIGGDTGSFVVVCIAITSVLASAITARTLPQGLLGPHEENGSTIRDVISGLRDGVRHLYAQVVVPRAMTMVVIHRLVFGMLLVSALLLARNTLHPNDPDAALATIAMVGGAAAIGAFIGAVITPALAHQLGLVRWPSLALATGAVISVGSWLTGTVIGFSVGGLIIGIAATSTKVCADALTQQLIHDDHRGRVFSLYDIAINLGLMCGVLLAAVTIPESGQAALQLSAMALVALIAAIVHATKSAQVQ